MPSTTQRWCATRACQSRSKSYPCQRGRTRHGPGQTVSIWQGIAEIYVSLWCRLRDLCLVVVQTSTILVGEPATSSAPARSALAGVIGLAPNVSLQPLARRLGPPRGRQPPRTGASLQTTATWSRRCGSLASYRLIRSTPTASGEEYGVRLGVRLDELPFIGAPTSDGAFRPRIGLNVAVSAIARLDAYLGVS